MDASSWTEFSEAPSHRSDGSSGGRGRAGGGYGAGAARGSGAATGRGSGGRIGADFSVTETHGGVRASATVPDTVEHGGHSGCGGSGGGRGRPGTSGGPAADASLMAAMHGAMAGTLTTGHGRGRTMPLHHSVLAAIADDRELTMKFPGITSVTKEMVSAVACRTKEQMNAAVRAISKAQKVSLCFVVDTTGSMGSHINGVLSQIEAIVAKVLKSGCRIAGLAFVGYKDWCDGGDHFEVLPFTTDQKAFVRFTAKIVATGGGDSPEDVLGGLWKAVRLEWPENSGARVLFHIADAPPHGRVRGKGQHFHDMHDDHPDGHSSDVNLETLFTSMRDRELDYYFGRINSTTDTMLGIFERFYGQAIGCYDTKDPGSIAASVSDSIMGSVSARSAMASDTGRSGRPRELPRLDKAPPHWPGVPVQDCTVMSYWLPESVGEIRSMEPLKEEVVKGAVQVAELPFDFGSVRMAYYARRLYITTRTGVAATPMCDVPSSAAGKYQSADEVVLKEFIKPSTEERLTRHRYMVDLETQAVAAMLAFEFNKALDKTTGRSPIRVKYLMAKLVRIQPAWGSMRFMAVEKKFRGEVAMVKYTNNYSFVRTGESEEFTERCGLAVAFSHFTYEHTGKYLMVTDLQGIDSKDGRDRDTLLLTDPAIHCPGVLRFGKTNMQQAGVDAFFKVHVCNEYCRALRLSPAGGPPAPAP